MELIKKSDKEGGLVAGSTHSLEKNLERHRFLMEHRHQFDPLVEIVPPEIAEEVWPVLEPLGEPFTQAKTRAQIRAVVEFLLEPGSFRKSTKAMCEELGLSYANWVHYTQVHPNIWRFINRVVGPILLLRSQTRVLAATEDAAINGDHRDRRLFFELDGSLKRGGGTGGGGQSIVINLINDNLDRPGGQRAEATVIEAQVTDKKERGED